MTNTTQTKPTEQQISAIRRTACAILEAITAAGDYGIPSGHLYANLMGIMSIDTYNYFINYLVRAGKITDKGHLLKAI